MRLFPLRQRAERRQLMIAEAELLGELRRLRSRVPQVTGVLAASVDGLVLAQDAAESEAEAVAALTAAALGVGSRLTETTGQGHFRELLVRGADGYVATYAAGTHAVLTVLAEPRVNVGRLHLEARRSSTVIGELVDASAAATPPVPAVPPRPVGPPTPVPIPVRRPGASGARGDT
ncbi:roadblock/LC7 domain-containing protein [Streptomyces uncialis]|uniref:roadblock/LC7 domain-containing protein n=1 Tax=Streptomyces uncialis TaxID=1048205 RepID=UPI0038236B13